MPRHDASSRPYDLDRVVRLVLGVITILALLWLVRYLADVLIPFAIAVLLAYLINPIVNALEGRIRSRTAAVLITVFGCLVVLAALLAIAIPIIGNEISDFGSLVGQLRADVASESADGQSLGERYEAYVASQESETVRRILRGIKDAVTSDGFRQVAIAAGKRIAGRLWGLITSVVSLVLGLTGLIIVVLYVIFLSIDYGRLSAKWKEYLPPKHRDSIADFVTDFSLAMRRYFRGQFYIASIVGLLSAFGFWLIDLRMGVVLGLLVGLLNMVPYLQAVAIVPALLLGVIRAIEHETGIVASLALVLLVFAVVQVIQDALLTPKIMGKQTGLRPAVLLLGVFIWGKLLGFLGLILAIPLTCLGIAFYRRWVLGDATASAAGS